MADLPSSRPDNPQTATLNSHPLAEVDTARPESPSDDPVPMQSPMHSMAYEQEYEDSTAGMPTLHASITMDTCVQRAQV